MTRRVAIAAALLLAGCGSSPWNRERGGQSGKIGAAPVTVALNIDSPVEIELDQFDRDLALKVGADVYDSRETGPETILLEGGVRSVEIQPVAKGSRESRWRLRVVDSGSIPHFRERREAVRFLREAKLAFDAGQVRKTVAALESAEAKARAAGDTEAEATAISYRGAVASLTGNYPEALVLLGKSRTLLEQTGSKWILHECINNLGHTYWRLGKYQQADEQFSKALEMSLAFGDPRGEAAALSNLGNVRQEAGEFSQALLLHERALELATAAGDANFQALIHNNKALAQLGLGKPAEAMAGFERARAIFERIGERRAATRAALRIAEVRFDSGENPVEQLAYARRIATEDGDLAALSGILTGEGRVAARTQRKAEAARLFQAALKSATNVPASRALILNELGKVLGPAGQPQLEAALELRRQLGARQGVAETLYSMAANARQLGNRGQAREWIAEAIREIESLRSLVRGPSHRITYLAARRLYYAFAVDLLSEMGQSAAALETAEQSRSRALLDQLGDSAARIEASAAPEKTLERERVAREIRLLSARLAEGPRAGVRERIGELLESYHRLESEIHAASPELAALTPKVADAPTIRASLESGSVLLQYFLSEPNSHLWIVDRARIRPYALPGRAQLEKLAVACISRWAAPPAGPKPGCKQLAEILLPQPIQSRRLIVAADGVLHRVPFAAFAPAGTEEIAMVPSISVAGAIRSRAGAPASGPIEILADPVFDEGDGRLAEPRDTAAPPEFRRLGFTRREATAVASILSGANARYDFDVAREFIAQGGLDRARIIHIATHAVADEQQPELSRLILSRYERNGKPRDGVLFLPDIARLRLSARLVTLSACSAGRGARIEGEGPIHLARAFLNAGAQAVVVSLWDVEDEATAQLMRRFYGYMSGSNPKNSAAALLAAQQDLSRQARWRHPFYWAGWTLVGDWR